jgi:hypothetical protein
MLEFNHAITFVNKIKQRYNTDTETYKQFLEILQTYQRDGRHIQEVSTESYRAIGDSGRSSVAKRVGVARLSRVTLTYTGV